MNKKVKALCWGAASLAVVANVAVGVGELRKNICDQTLFVQDALNQVGVKPQSITGRTVTFATVGGTLVGAVIGFGREAIIHPKLYQDYPVCAAGQ